VKREKFCLMKKRMSKIMRKKRSLNNRLSSLTRVRGLVKSKAVTILNKWTSSLQVLGQRSVSFSRRVRTVSH
jgi:hypothetical protein